MKKSFLLTLLTIVFISCSSDDSGNSTETDSFSPPEWILGRWTVTSGTGKLMETPSGTETGFEFKDDDFCYITSGVTTCFKAMQETTNGTIIEEKSDTHYKVSVTIQGTTYQYHFVKISDTEIQEILAAPSGGVSYYSADSEDGDNSPSLPITLDFTNLNLADGATFLTMNGVTVRSGQLGVGVNNLCSMESSNHPLYLLDANNPPESIYDRFPDKSGLVVDYDWDYNDAGVGYESLFFETNLLSVQKITIELSMGTREDSHVIIQICNENGGILTPGEIFSGEGEIAVNVGGQNVHKIIVAIIDTTLDKTVIHSLKIE